MVNLTERTEDLTLLNREKGLKLLNFIHYEFRLPSTRRLYRIVLKSFKIKPAKIVKSNNEAEHVLQVNKINT